MPPFRFTRDTETNVGYVLSKFQARPLPRLSPCRGSDLPFFEKRLKKRQITTEL